MLVAVSASDSMILPQPACRKSFALATAECDHIIVLPL